MRIIPRFHLLPVAIILFTAPFLPACGQQNKTPAQHVTKAEDYIDKGELRAAAIELRNALQKAPDTLEARWLLGKVSLELGDFAAAEKELDRAVKLGLAQQAAQPVKTKAIILQADYDRLLAETTQVAPGMPEEDQALIMGLRGHAYLGKSEFDQARVAFEKALEMDTASSEALVGMASLNGLQGKHEEARRWVNRALDANASSADAWIVLGDVESAEGNYEAAEAAYSKAIGFQVYPGLYRAKRAHARIKLGKYPEAEADLQMLKQQRQLKDHPYVNYVSGLGYFGRHKYNEAVQAFEASNARTPSSPQTEVYLAASHFAQGNLQQASVYAERLYTRFPQSKTNATLMGLALLVGSDLDAAKDVFQNSLNNFPDDSLVLSLLANIALVEGDAAKSIEYSQKLALLEPDSQPVMNMLNTAKLLDGQALDKEYGVGQGEEMSASEDKFKQQLLYAIEAFRDKNFGQALERAQKLHEDYPDKLDPINLMSACYLALGELEKSKVELEKILEMSPNNPEAAKNLARLEIRGGNFEHARVLMKQLLVEFPQDEDAALSLAETEVRLGSQASAIKVLEQAMESNPKALSVRAQLAKEYFRADRIKEVLRVTRGLDAGQLKKQPNLLELRGKAQMRSGNASSASRSFELLSEAAPDSVTARYFYAESLAKSGKVKRAEEEMKVAVAIDPDYLPARLGEIRMLVQTGERAHAIEAMAAVKRDFGEQPEILGLAGWLSLHEGDYVTAEEYLARATEQVPDSALTVYLVKAMWEQKKHEQAIIVMRDWLERNPQDLEVLLRLASAYLSLNREAEARSTYANVVEFYPDYVPALNNLAFLLGEEGNLEQAIIHAERAYELSPQDPTVLDTLGMLLLERGDIERGFNRIMEAAERSEDPRVQLHLGRAFMAKGKFHEAKKILNTLISSDPGSQTAREAEVLLQSMVRK